MNQAGGEIEPNESKPTTKLTVVFPKYGVPDNGRVLLIRLDQHGRRAAPEVALVQVKRPFAGNDRLRRMRTITISKVVSFIAW